MLSKPQKHHRCLPMQACLSSFIDTASSEAAAPIMKDCIWTAHH